MDFGEMSKQRIRRRVLMNFQHYKDGWSVHFLEADCKTPVTPRYYDFASAEEIRTMVLLTNPPAGTLAEFDMAVRAWGHGSVFLEMTEVQYQRIRGGRWGRQVANA